MAKRLVVILLLLATAVLSVLVGLTIHRRFRSHEITIAAGNAKSSGYILMSALQTVIAHRHPRIKITVHETSGAEDSLTRLEMDSAQLAVVEADAAIPPSARTATFGLTEAG